MNLEMIREIITCPVCLKTFNKVSKCPRMLSCGHSFCHSCLKTFVVKRPRCPTCNTAILFPKIESIPVNFAIESLINVQCRDTTTTEHDDCEGESDEPRSSIGQPREKKSKLASEGYCKEHANFKEFRCMNCDVWICGTCATLLHKQCKTLLVSEARKELEIRKVVQKLDKELVSIKRTKDCFTESLIVLDDERKALIEEIQEKNLQLRDRKKRFKMLSHLRSEKIKYSNKLEQLKATVESTASDTELAEAKNELDKLLEEGVNHTLESMWTLCQHKSVYVVEDSYDCDRYGKMAIRKDGRTKVSCFKLEKPDDTRIIIDFKDLLAGLDEPNELPKTVFLQLTPVRADTDNDSIEVVIETDNLSPRAKNFIFLCAGLKGPSYRGMLLHDFNDCYHTGHDLNPPVLEDISYDNCSTTLLEAGLYGMLEENSGFRIQLKDNSLLCVPKLGAVVAGFQFLKDSNVGDCRITDCGLVF